MTSLDIINNFKPLPLPMASHPLFPPSLREPTLELATSHLVCSVALTGVLVLQAGRWWAEQKDDDEEEEVEAVISKEKESVGSKSS